MPTGNLGTQEALTFTTVSAKNLPFSFPTDHPRPLTYQFLGISFKVHTVPDSSLGMGGKGYTAPDLFVITE